MNKQIYKKKEKKLSYFRDHITQCRDKANLIHSHVGQQNTYMNLYVFIYLTNYSNVTSMIV